MTGPGAGSWLPDPEGRYDYRWWDLQSRSDQVSHLDPLGRAPLSAVPAPRQQVRAQSQPRQASTWAAGDGFAEGIEIPVQ